MTGDGFSNKLLQLLPRVREKREEIERTRHLPRELVGRLIETGVFGLAVPRALGGEELDPIDHLRVIETVSAADGSTGWCVMIALGNGVFAGYMTEPGAKEVFADPAQPTAAVLAPLGQAVHVDGGLRVSGRWRFASGIGHVDWVFGGCLVMENGAPKMTAGGPEMTHVVMPKSSVIVSDTWYASGLCGTGSQDFEANNVFVPEERVMSAFDPAAHRPEPLYQVPLLALFTPHLAAVGLGIARAALDDLMELAARKTPSLSAVRMADKPVTQVELARAEAALGSARAFLYDALDDLWQTVVAGRSPTKRQHAMCRIASVHAADTSADVTRRVSMLAGGTSIYSASPFQRYARDADAVTHHSTQSPQTWEECGRVLLGLDPQFPVF